MYKGSFTLKTLAQFDKKLSKFDVEDMIEIFQTAINNKGLDIVKENMNLVTKWKICVVKEIEIKLILNAFEPDEKLFKENIINSFEGLKKEIGDLKKENEVIRKENDSIKNTMKELQEKLTNLEIKNPFLFRVVKGFDNDIIKDQSEISLIFNRIYKVNEYFFNKDVNLIYKATKDGDTASAFHKACEGKGPTITLIKTNKNKRFGGYSEAKWPTNGNYGKDPNSFLFSFDNNQVYKVIKEDYAIYSHSGSGPAFGQGCDLCIYENFFSNTSTFEQQNNSSSYDFNGRPECNGIETTRKYFLATEVEVYEFI